jgi:hypothetical protein
MVEWTNVSTASLDPGLAGCEKLAKCGGNPITGLVTSEQVADCGPAHARGPGNA